MANQYKKTEKIASHLMDSLSFFIIMCLFIFTYWIVEWTQEPFELVSNFKHSVSPNGNKIDPTKNKIPIVMQGDTIVTQLNGNLLVDGKAEYHKILRNIDTGSELQIDEEPQVIKVLTHPVKTEKLNFSTKYMIPGKISPGTYEVFTRVNYSINGNILSYMINRVKDYPAIKIKIIARQKTFSIGLVTRSTNFIAPAIITPKELTGIGEDRKSYHKLRKTLKLRLGQNGWGIDEMSRWCEKMNVLNKGLGFVCLDPKKIKMESK